ncbi:hypothetical protein [Thermococcus barossii]|nr:hypothetical protein [Thermococcus barossii]
MSKEMRLKNPYRAIGYFIAFTLAGYLLLLAFKSMFPTVTLEIRGAFIGLEFCLIYLIARIFHGSPFKPTKGAPYLESLRHVLGLLLIGYVSPVIVIIIAGPQSVFQDARPPFVDTWSPFILAFALIHWGVISVMVAYFYHAVTYDLFSKLSRFFGILGATALVTINYNFPLLSNYWNLWDILFFGLVFAYSYSVNRNPAALASAYLLSEVPLWWCILAPLGAPTLATYFVGRFWISLIALLSLFKSGPKFNFRAS